MKCLVTGGAGFIGSHLVEGLLARGHSARVLDDLSSGKLSNLEHLSGVECVSGSVIDPDVVDKVVDGCEYVFHLAAIPSVVKSVEDPLRTHEVGVTGTLHVLEAAKRHGVRRVVFAGSSSAYGDQPGDVRHENDLLSPLSPYAAAKLAGEHYCSAYTAVFGLETVRLRFFNVFGPRQDPSSPYSGVIAIFSEAMKAGRTPKIFGDGLQTRDFVHVSNVIDAIWLAATVEGVGGNVYNVGMGERVTILDLARTLNELLGTSIEPKHEPPRAGDVRYSQADISRARQDLGFEPEVSFREGLKETLESY